MAERRQSEPSTVVVNWCGYGTDEGCGYICTESTTYCHHCGRKPVERVRLTVDRYLGRAGEEPES